MIKNIKAPILVFAKRYLRNKEAEELEKYMNILIEEAEQDNVYYTEEEFWKIVEQEEIEEYGKPISYSICKKYA